jgi:hypothetical protein
LNRLRFGAALFDRHTATRTLTAAGSFPKGGEHEGKARKQIDNLARVLEERGVIVHRSRRLNAEEMKYLDYVQGRQQG